MNRRSFLTFVLHVAVKTDENWALCSANNDVYFAGVYVHTFWGFFMVQPRKIDYFLNQQIEIFNLFSYIIKIT